MDWRILSMLSLLMWAVYAIFGSLAIKIHGERVSMVVEAVAMVVIAIGMVIVVGVNDFKRATTMSLTFAAVMGLMSAGGVLIQFMALRVAPVSQQGTVFLIGGMYPVLAVVLFHAMTKLGLSGGAAASPRQWLGVVFGAAALWLVSGK